MISPVFVAINSRYNHTNLAIRSIASYVFAQSGITSTLVEKTISEPFPVILRSVFDAINTDDTTQPVLILFSVYIWNASLMFDLIQEIKKIFPNSVLGAGGPEVSYCASKVFENVPSLDFIMKGEGEQTATECISLFSSICEKYQNSEKYKKASTLKYDSRQPKKSVSTDFSTQLESIRSVYIAKKSEGEQAFTVIFTGERDVFPSLDVLPFPYPSLVKETEKVAFTDILDPSIHIFYYESSRGCPFRCSYCLSSIEKTVRFMSLDRVYKDLEVFLEQKVHLVKFVDRTFNIDEDRYLSIWKYIVDHHNGITMFHFEIAAEQFTQKVLDYLQTVSEGVMQFEVGIQTMNPQTLLQIHRPFDRNHLASIIRQVPKTIHMHLDLIAGLPHENMESFRSSFDGTIAFKPDMLQLGFLKILYGTEMEHYAKDENKKYFWLDIPPYEVLQSSNMTYSDLLFLKDLEHVLDVYYNSGNFKTLCSYIFERGKSLFDFFSSLVHFFRSKSYFDVKHKTQAYYAFFYEYLTEKGSHSFFTESEKAVLFELLRFDFLLLTKPGSSPSWFTRLYSKDLHHKALLEHTEMKSTREAYSYSDYDEFTVHPYSFTKESVRVLFLYPKPQQGKRSYSRAIILD